MDFKTLVIIPAFNEEQTIRQVVRTVLETDPEYRVLVIDDGSDDLTAEEAVAAGARVISHSSNLGYGVALQTGYKYMLRNAYQALVQIDGDGQHEARDIAVLLKVLKEDRADLVLGSRFLGNGNYQPSFLRMLGIRFFRLLLRLFAGREISDPTTGFQAVNRKVLELFATDIFPCDYPDADVILLTRKLGFRITEEPVRMYPSTNGKSMHNNPFNVMFYLFKMLLSLFLMHFRKLNIEAEQLVKGGE